MMQHLDDVEFQVAGLETARARVPLAPPTLPHHRQLCTALHWLVPWLTACVQAHPDHPGVPEAVFFIIRRAFQGEAFVALAQRLLPLLVSSLARYSPGAHRQAGRITALKEVAACLCNCARVVVTQPCFPEVLTHLRHWLRRCIDDEGACPCTRRPGQDLLAGGRPLPNHTP
jgi:hypothetical protein